MRHRLRETHRAGDDGFAAPVGSGQHIDGGVFVKNQVVGHDRVVHFQRNGGIVKRNRAIDPFRCGSDDRHAEVVAFDFQRPHQIGGFLQELKFRQQPQQKIRVFQHVGLYDFFPGAERLAVNVIDGGGEGKREGGFLIFVLLFAERRQFGNAGVAVVFEIEMEDFLQGVAGVKDLRVNGKHTGFPRAQLRVQIDPDGHAFDFAHPAGQLRQSLVELCVIIAFYQLRNAGGKPGKRRAVIMRSAFADPLVQDVDAGNIQLDFGHTGKIIRRVAAVALQSPQFHNIKQHRHQFGKRVAQFFVGKQIAKHRLPVTDDFRVPGDKIRNAGVFERHDLGKTQFLQGKFIDFRFVGTRIMRGFAFRIGVKQAETCEIHIRHRNILLKRNTQKQYNINSGKKQFFLKKLQVSAVKSCKIFKCAGRDG